MPELPEVETTVRYIKEKIAYKRITSVLVRQPSLRYKIRSNLPKLLKNQIIQDVSRRAKYILISLNEGYLIIHLGMSGSLQITNAKEPIQKHSHCDIMFDNIILRYNDPRRFGCILWETDLASNKLLANLGIEPLGDDFNGQSLYKLTRGRKVCIKQFIMNPHNLVGVGNIYANESLWKSGITPLKPAKECSEKQCELLADEIKNTLLKSIAAGGTTLKDFKGADGKLGYFVRQLQIYGKEDQACPKCGSEIKRVVIGQRSSFYCLKCQA